jgi:uncharacterized protein YndB with AHSA1/START domain
MTATSNAATEPANQEFVLTRTFDAPRDLVWKAHTEADRLKQWWGPKSFTMISCDVDLRPGGVFHYGMKAPNGTEMWGKWVFREIESSERLVFVSTFSDKEGGVTENPFMSDWPLETLSTMTFTEEDGKTTLTMRAVPLNASETEVKNFVEAFGGMTKGWKGTLDALEAYLATA